jgi:hypothetical protein
VIHILAPLRVIEVEAGIKLEERENIMAMKPFVRIIKRGQKVAGSERTEGSGQPRATAESSARVVKNTVSNWVREFQQRSRTDSKRAFNNLFTEPLARPSET